MRIAAQQQQKPWSPLQKAPSHLGTVEGRVHLDGVRWDIENAPDGQALEKGVFRDAYVQPERVKEVFLCIKPFSDKPGGVPGHALLDFQFESDAPVTDSQGNRDTGLAVSMEVHFREGEGYDPGSSKPQPILYQLGTWKDAIEKATVFDHYPLKRYKLKLNHDQQVALLKERLNEATKDHSQNLYDPVTNSCLSTLIDGVNQVLPESQRMSHSKPDGSPDPNATIPVWTHRLFYQHGLLHKLTPDEVYPGA